MTLSHVSALSLTLLIALPTQSKYTKCLYLGNIYTLVRFDLQIIITKTNKNIAIGNNNDLLKKSQPGI